MFKCQSLRADYEGEKYVLLWSLVLFQYLYYKDDKGLCNKRYNLMPYFKIVNVDTISKV